jgi:hypothetical protein
VAERLAEWPEPQPDRAKLRRRRLRLQAQGKMLPMLSASSPAISAYYRDEAIPIAAAVLMTRGHFHADVAARAHGMTAAAAPMLRVLAGLEDIPLPGLRCKRCLRRLDRWTKAREDGSGFCGLCLKKPRSLDVHVERTERARVMLAAGADAREIAAELGLSHRYFEARYMKFIRQIAPAPAYRQR